MIRQWTYVFNWARKSAYGRLTSGWRLRHSSDPSSNRAVRYRALWVGVFRRARGRSIWDRLGDGHAEDGSGGGKRIYDQMPERRGLISMGECSSVAGHSITLPCCRARPAIVPTGVYVIGCAAPRNHPLRLGHLVVNSLTTGPYSDVTVQRRSSDPTAAGSARKPPTKARDYRTARSKTRSYRWRRKPARTSSAERRLRAQ